MTTNTKLNELGFLKMADTLNQSEQYRVITKYNKPEFYNICADVPKKIGVFLDIEATGVTGQAYWPNKIEGSPSINVESLNHRNPCSIKESCIAFSI